MRPELLKYQEESEYFFREGCWINEMSNRDSDPALSIARARVTPGGTTRWHRLSATTERYVMLAGSGLVELEEATGVTYNFEVAEGDTVIIPPDCWQRITNTCQEDLVFLALCTPRFLEQSYEQRE